LIKTKNRLLLEEVDNLDMPLEYRAINALQKTEWAINKNILSVLETIWEQGGGWAGVPNREDLPIPPCPFPKEVTKADMNDLEKIEFKRWKRRASIIYAKNGKIKSKRLAFVRSLQMAQEYEKLPLHFVFQNDFRGRKYAASSFVTPQGTDYSKGLLYFGKSKPRTPTPIGPGP
jgi:DNA-directed RNA polymerase